MALNRIVGISDFIEDSPTSDMGIHDKIIFIARGKSKRRQISNEREVIDFIRSRISNMEVHMFDDDSSALDQAILFSRCKVIIGLHGAGLANLLWMFRSDGYVYEITPRGGHYHDYKMKAENRGMKHRYIEIEKHKKSEKVLLYPRDSILTMSCEEMDHMEDIMIEDGLIKVRESERFTSPLPPVRGREGFSPRILSNQVVLSDEIDEAIWRRIPVIPFESKWLKD